jgi:hypothetical protein
MIPRFRMAVVAAALVGLAACSHDRTPVGAQRSPGPRIVPVPAADAVGSPTPDNPFALYVQAADGVLVANPSITPGHADAGVTAALVCQPGYGASLRHPDYGARAKAFADYAVPWSERKSYQLDNLVPLELGGDNSKANLWPMPLIGRGSPTLKDALATRLHALVCTSKLPLATAQAAIAANWWTAYQQYGGAKPVPNEVPGQKCAPAGAIAQTKTGKQVACANEPDGTPRWAVVVPPSPPPSAHPVATAPSGAAKPAAKATPKPTPKATPKPAPKPTPQPSLAPPASPPPPASPSLSASPSPPASLSG